MTHPTPRWRSAGMRHVGAGDDWIDQALRARLSSMTYRKRRDEAALGRWTAKHAVASYLGLDPDPPVLRRIVVRNAPDGAPEVDIDGDPLEAVIAMTDRADWAVAMLLAGTRRIGCDLEVVEPRSGAFVRDYFTPAEQDAVSAAASPDLVANLVWSAKESALKVLRTGLRRDTRTVEVTAPEPFDGGAERRWHPLTVSTIEGDRFPGWWLRTGAFVLTCASEVDTDPPRSLDEPPALLEATPTHGWLDDPLVG